MKNLALLLCAALYLITGCGTTSGLVYKSEEENQLTRGEELLFIQKARLYAKQNNRAYRISSKEINELDRIAPDVRVYCEAYKYGDISVSWTLKSGKIIVVKARGHLLDPETVLSIRVMRFVDQPTKGTLKARKKLKDARENAAGNANK